ncbi:phage portal protein family protein [Pseudomonas helleri]|uniref:phage portal protein family protein n=1 Tax=Pseudomonas helleri TaxID=1608996 RepID=UPI00243079D1|nr:hypothetical protein [Pseudomonas helleri]
MENIEKAVDASLPRMRMGEIGHSGLNVINGRIYEESRRELRWPEAGRTFAIMSQDATIKAALLLFEMMVSRVEWTTNVESESSAALKAKAQFLKECMEDMDHTWASFIKEVTSAFTYGFCVNEKVYRRRLVENGSKYNDGKIGIKRLPVRAQESISKWLYTADGRDLIGLEQNVAALQGGGRYAGLLSGGKTEITIPRKKFMLFRTDPVRDNPEGNSPLKGCYFAWKYRTTIEEQEAIGVTRDMNGMPTLYIPPRYMSEDASPSERAIYDYYKRIIRNIQMNEQSGMILPQAFDPESRQPLFKFELTSTQGSKMYDTDAIIKRWDNKILMVLFADMLKMGQDQVGSYSLAGAKTNIMTMAIEARLKEIQDVLNFDLVPQLFALNGFDPSEELPRFEYGELAPIDLEEFAKAAQQVLSVGGMEVDREFMNHSRRAFKLKPKPDDEPVDREALPLVNESKAGEGYKTAGEGTAKSPGGKDASAANKSN